MALDTYAGLSASLQTWATRTYAQPQIDEFIAMAEAAFNRRLQGYQREVTTTLATNSNGIVALPTGFVGMRSVTQNDIPFEYGISGSNLQITNGASQSFVVIYFAKLTPLSSTNASNWLLAAAPDAYLFMCKAQQRAFEEEWQAAAGFKAQAEAMVDDLTMQNTVAQYSRASLQMPIAP